MDILVQALSFLFSVDSANIFSPEQQPYFTEISFLKHTAAVISEDMSIMWCCS